MLYYCKKCGRQVLKDANREKNVIFVNALFNQCQMNIWVDVLKDLLRKN